MSTEKLPVMETFYTIQGEGEHTGKPAYFIRLGGCDVGCTWCDVKESWNKNQHLSLSVEEMVTKTTEHQAEIAIITGGEPLMHNLDSLTRLLQKNGVNVHLETSGVYPLSGNWHWICFSPKKFKTPRAEFYEAANELKVVIFHPSDLAWAEEHAEKVGGNCQLFLQPEWEKKDKVLPLIIDYVKKNPKWRISIQSHKYMNVP